jgi:carbon storage regulator
MDDRFFDGGDTMLVLTRKVGERIVIDGTITVHVLDVTGNRARIGIQAPRRLAVQREELLAREAHAAQPAGSARLDG